MGAIFDLLNVIVEGFSYVVAGLFGLIILIVTFDKEVESLYNLEAEFQDSDGNSTEFDIKLWRYAREASDYQLKASFLWNDVRLLVGGKVSVYLNESLVLEGVVEKTASIRLSNKHIQNTPVKAQQGDECRILLNGNLAFKQAVLGG